MSLNSLRKELLDLGEGLPFILIVGEVIKVPELDPDWEEPEGFDWESGEAPIIGYYDNFSVGWRWEYKGENYGNYFYACDGVPAKSIINAVICNFEYSKDAIKEGTWTAR